MSTVVVFLMHTVNVAMLLKFLMLDYEGFDAKTTADVVAIAPFAK